MRERAAKRKQEIKGKSKNKKDTEKEKEIQEWEDKSEIYGDIYREKRKKGRGGGHVQEGERDIERGREDDETEEKTRPCLLAH